MSNILVNILFAVLGSETFKTLIKKATRKVVESKNINIDKDLASALITDIEASNGNKLGKDLAQTVIRSL